MAILEKRKSVNQLPRFERYQDTRAGDRAAALRGEPARLRSEAPITSAIRQLAGSSGYGPMGDQGFNQMGKNPAMGLGNLGNAVAGGAGPIGGAGRATVDKFGNTAGQPQTAVTSALKGSTGATAGKATGTGATAGKVAGTTPTTSKLPGLTSKVATDAKTDATKAATGAKTITSTANPATGAKTLTSTGSGKTAGVTTGTGAKTTGSTLGNTLTSALAGAALGAGTKFVIDKLTGTKKAADTGAETVAGTDKVVAGTNKVAGTAGTVAGTNKVAGTDKVAGTVAGTGLTSKVNPLGTNIGKNIVDTGVQKAVDATKTVPTSVVKGAAPTAKVTTPKTGTPPFVPASAKAPTGAKAPVTSGAKAPATTGPKTPKEAVAKAPTTSTTRGLGASTGETKNDNILKEDTVVTGVAYDEDGNLMPGYELDENGNPVFVGDSNSSTTYNPDGSTGVESTGVAYDEDGNLMPGYELDENGDPVFVGDATSTIYDPSGGSITSDTKTIDDLDTVDNSGGGDSIVETGGDSGGLFSDTYGNLYDAEGNLVQYADGTLVGEGATSEENSFDNEVAFTDENGDTYNASGVLLSEGDHSDYVYTAEDGSTYDYDGKLITEADHSGFVQYDAAGNSFDYDGNIIAYADGYGAQDEYAAGDEYTAADEFSDEDLYGAKGGLIGMRRGGAPVHMVHGGDPSEDGEPISEEENADGTITQHFDDGSSIIYNQDGEVVKVAEAKGYADGNLVSKYSTDQIAELIKLREQASSRKLTDYEREDIESQIAEIENNPSGEPTVEENSIPAEVAQESNQTRESIPPLEFDDSIFDNFGGKDVYSDPFTKGFGSALPPDTTNDLAETNQNTQYWDDGSSITYDKEGSVIGVTNADGTKSTPTDRALTLNDARPLVALPDTNVDRRNVVSVGEESFDPTYTPRVVGKGAPEGSTPFVTGAKGVAPPEGWPPAGFSLNDDGSNTATYVDPKDGSTVTIDVDNNIVKVADANGKTVVQDNQPVTTGGLTQANQNIQYFDDGSYIQTFDDGTSITFDSDGNPFRSTDTEGNSQLATTTTYDDEGNKTISDYYGNIVKVLDPQGNVIPLGGGRVNTAPITSVGSAGAAKTPPPPANDPNIGPDTKSAIDKLLAGLNTYGGAGAAGAVLGGLLGNTDLFGGGGGGNSFDMGGYGAIDPRTTNFGVGPANYVGYDEYGTPEEMPELYGNELYQNLNAPGFNEVNPGDYARMDEKEFGSQPMADGGMPQGGLGQTSPQTYYTFGKPVDPLQNLRNPMPFQHQQQMPPQAIQQPPQMPQGAPPPMGQGMPQMGMPPQMRRGGLPHASNVPMTQGRMDFRQGSAVHGAGDGQSDDIPAMLADGEYVFDADTVAQIGNGSTKAGAEALDRFRENIRAHKRSAPVNKIPPKTKALTSYLKGAR